ncbi:MAG: cytochrome c family protein, partial [Polyangiaceae bacterium]
PDASASSAAPIEPTQGKANRYIGAQKCKTCHGKDETGNQHKVWSAGKHAHAFEVLASDRAKEVGKEKGIADPQKDAACIECHQTAYGLDAALIQKGFDPSLGVQCETCHGPGEQHMMARMKAASEKVDGYPKIPDGEIIALPTKEACVACHNPKSPTFQPFCIHERLEKIKHWNPNRPRTEEQKKGYPCTCDDTCICKKDSPEHKCRDAK